MHFIGRLSPLLPRVWIADTDNLMLMFIQSWWKPHREFKSGSKLWGAEYEPSLPSTAVPTHSLS